MAYSSFTIINGCHRFIIQTIDTDVVGIIVGKLYHLKLLCEDVDIWVTFGIRKHFSYIYINALYEDLGQEKSRALPVFNSFTGCGTTSTLYG